MNNREQMLKDISVLDFTLTELGLYLDTHPEDQSAIEYFNHYSRMKQQLERDFSRSYYPLTMEQAESRNEWRWGAAPLPWEGACG